MGTEGFSFEIVGSAEKADKSIDGVLNKLDAIAPRASKASTEITNAFQRATMIVEQFAHAQQQGGQAARNYAESVAPAVQQTRMLIEQLQREQDVFDSIRGPIQETANEINALTQLVSKGAITVREFNDRIAQIRAPKISMPAGGGGGFDLGSLAGSLPGGSIIAGAAGGGVAGAAMAGVQSAIGAASQIIEMSDAYAGLMNRLKSLTGSQQAASDLFEKLSQSASHTRSDINTTTTAFVRITNATRSLGLSQNQVLTFTEHLNEMMSMGGGTAEETAASMLQLSQALASGVLRGDEFNSVMENAQPIQMALMQHLHVTQGELRKMAESGQISAKTVYDSIEAMGTATEQGFAQTVPTISQQMTVFHNVLMKTVGETMASVNASGAAGEAIQTLGLIVQATADQFKYVNDSLGVVGLHVSDMTAGIGTSTVKLLGELDYSWDGLKHAITGTAAPLEHYLSQQDVINRTVAQGTGSIGEYSRAMVENTLRTVLGTNAANEFAKALPHVETAAEQARDRIQSLGAGVAVFTTSASKLIEKFATNMGEKGLGGMIAQTIDPWDQATAAVNRHNKALQHQLDILADIRRRQAVAKAHAELQPDYGDDLIFGKATKHEYKDSDERDKKINDQIKKREAAERKADADAAKAAEDLAKKQVEAAQRAHEAWANTATDVATSLLNGEKSWQDWASAAEQAIERAIIKMLILKAIEGVTSGGASLAVSGGAGLVDQIAPMGFATGGQFMVGGRGGTDQNLVAFRASNDERVTVETADDQRNGKYFGGGGNITIAPTFKVLQAPERRDIVDMSRNGLTNFVQLQRQMPNRRR
jgi:tape measure domain-containing protein